MTSRMTRVSMVLVLLLSMALVVGCPPPEVEAKWDDGIFIGEGRGFKDVIRVEVTIERGKIVDVLVVEHSETPILSDAAMERVPSDIIEHQTWEVDIVSGATVTSRGIMEAVKQALLKAERN